MIVAASRSRCARSRSRRSSESAYWLYVAPICAAARSAVNDELEQRSIRIAKVQARAGTARADALGRAFDHLDAVRGQVRLRLFDRAVPAEAQVAVPRPHRVDRARRRGVAGTVDVELGAAGESIADAPIRQVDHLGAEDVAVERGRAVVVRDGDDDVIEGGDPHGTSQRLPARAIPTRSWPAAST